MRKLGRMVRRVLTAVSLLLFLGVVVGWVSGYWVQGRFWVERRSLDDVSWRRTNWNLEWHCGELCIIRDWGYADAGQAKSSGLKPGIRWDNYFILQPANHFPVGTAEWIATRDQTYSKMPGIRSSHLKVADAAVATVQWRALYSSRREVLPDVFQHQLYLVIPFWVIGLVTGIHPAWWVWKMIGRRRRLRLASGCCVRCGYDLRASPWRCPECGTEVARRAYASGRAVDVARERAG